MAYDYTKWLILNTIHSRKKCKLYLNENILLFNRLLHRVIAIVLEVEIAAEISNDL